MDSRSGKANLMFNLMKHVAGPCFSVTPFVGLSFPSYEMKELLEPFQLIL